MYRERSKSRNIVCVGSAMRSGIESSEVGATIAPKEKHAKCQGAAAGPLRSTLACKPPESCGELAESVSHLLQL